MHAGKLKAFNTLTNFYSELRSYRRDHDGKIVKELDHLLDAMRYLVMARDGLTTKPVTDDSIERYLAERSYIRNNSGGLAWMY